MRSRPLLSRSGCIWVNIFKCYALFQFSSPFIEERLYLDGSIPSYGFKHVLVPFYRGAVVFPTDKNIVVRGKSCSRPLLSRSGCI